MVILLLFVYDDIGMIYIGIICKGSDKKGKEHRVGKTLVEQTSNVHFIAETEFVSCGTFPA